MAARLVLAVSGILWVAQGVSEPSVVEWRIPRIPPGLAFTWAGIAMFSLTAIEMVRCWTARGAETYEQYHARFTPVARALGLLLVAAIYYATYLYLS